MELGKLTLSAQTSKRVMTSTKSIIIGLTLVFMLSGCNTRMKETSNLDSRRNYEILYKRWEVETDPNIKRALARQIEADPTFQRDVKMAIEDLETMDPSFRNARRGIDKN